MRNLSFSRKASLMAAIIICVLAPTLGYIKIGWPPVVIVGGSALVGFFFWYFTYLKSPAAPRRILPLFILTVAGLQIHMVEEYLTGFGPAMSRVFDIPWTEERFLIVFMMIGPIVYTFTTLGLYYRIPLAGFVAWFIFIGPGVAEFAHFIFPLLKPFVEPQNISPVTMTIHGSEVADMPNYYYRTTGHYYFSGMWTAILPMIPGICAIYRLTKDARAVRTRHSE